MPLEVTNDFPDRDGWSGIRDHSYQTSPNERRDVGANARRAGDTLDGTVSFLTTAAGIIGFELVVGSGPQPSLIVRDAQHEYVCYRCGRGNWNGGLTTIAGTVRRPCSRLWKSRQATSSARYGSWLNQVERWFVLLTQPVAKARTRRAASVAGPRRPFTSRALAVSRERRSTTRSGVRRAETACLITSSAARPGVSVR